jgi:hypothetical protein
MSASDTTTRETVVLKGGTVVPLSALQIGWELEARGLTLAVDGADLVIRPAGRLTDDDRQRLRDNKPALMALVRYCDEVTL